MWQRVVTLIDMLGVNGWESFIHPFTWLLNLTFWSEEEDFGWDGHFLHADTPQLFADDIMQHVLGHVHVSLSGEGYVKSFMLKIANQNCCGILNEGVVVADQFCINDGTLDVNHPGGDKNANFFVSHSLLVKPIVKRILSGGMLLMAHLIPITLVATHSLSWPWLILVV